MTARRTLLIVDDSPDDVELAAMAFDEADVRARVVAVTDGREALDYLLAEGRYRGQNTLELPDVVLLDLNLPGVDGLEVLRRIRAHQRTRLLPVVVLTSSGDSQDVAAAYALGANSYVQKPVDFDQFVRAASRLGTYWLDVNRPVARGTP